LELFDTGADCIQCLRVTCGGLNASHGLGA
jgi:hypothetical protein